MSKFLKKTIFFFLVINIFIFISNELVISETAPQIPARIGGTVTIDGKICTVKSGADFTVKVTNVNGSFYAPETGYSSGLNSSGWYIVDILLGDKEVPLMKRPLSGDKSIIHIYKNGVKMKVIEPVNGIFAVGSSGSTTQIDVTAVSK